MGSVMALRQLKMPEIMTGSRLAGIKATALMKMFTTARHMLDQSKHMAKFSTKCRIPARSRGCHIIQPSTSYPPIVQTALSMAIRAGAWETIITGTIPAKEYSVFSKLRSGKRLTQSMCPISVT
jgi:hypothetical protein